MYLPAAFHVTDRKQLFDFIDAHSFGVLVSAGAELPLASHLPFLLDRETGPTGTLIGHMARANPHWQFADGQDVLVIFNGPHAYISPAWYEAENVVPTWNYVTVHAYGVLEPVFEEDKVLQIVGETTRKYESSRGEPWQFDGSTDFARRLAAAVVGFRIELTRLEGKWKLSQNHSPERRERVIAGLESQGTAESSAVAAQMRGCLPADSNARPTG